MGILSTPSLVIWLWLHIQVVSADIDSGCPFWGCLPSGGFTLSSATPSHDAKVQWKVKIEEGPLSAMSMLGSKGCVSDQQSVVCATTLGYVSIDPTNGEILWNYTTQTHPSLPIMDVYGNVIGMDSKALYSIRAGGFPQPPISVFQLMPKYSLMVTNNSLLLVTSSNRNANQVVTYTTDGLIDAGVVLKGTIDGVSGTFLPCGQSVISGFRAYVITCFTPDSGAYDQGHREASGKLRLYAIDITGAITTRIQIKWYLGIDGTRANQQHSNPNSEEKTNFRDSRENTLDPIVLSFDGKVYINVPEGLERMKNQHLTQPWPGTLWAVEDKGSSGAVVFNTSCLYGPMAAYESFGMPRGSKEDAWSLSVIWIMSRSPAMLQGFNSNTGQLVPTSGLDKILQSLGGWITSKLAITRPMTTTPAAADDQLVFGISDSSGQAKLAVIQVDLKGQAKLVFLREVSNNSSSNSESSYFLGGQLVNFAFIQSKRGDKQGQGNFTFGLAAVLTETTKKSFTRSVVGVF